MSVGHGEIRLGAECSRAGCRRAARELGGYCTRCWMALTAATRAHLVWLRDVDRQADAAAIAELRAHFALDAREPPGREAA